MGLYFMGGGGGRDEAYLVLARIFNLLVLATMYKVQAKGTNYRGVGLIASGPRLCKSRRDRTE